MSTQSEPPNISSVPVVLPPPQSSDKGENKQAGHADAFEEPGLTDLASLTDGRKLKEFSSAYPNSAWAQIIVEFVYLLTVLLFGMSALVMLAHYFVHRPSEGWLFYFVGKLPEGLPILTWAAVGLAGACGGCASSLKWLYHSVAKQRWHRDRFIWRVTVPILSSVLALFSGLMIISGIVPFLSKTPLNSPATGAAFGFFVGFFSDNVLAGLQKFAFRVFGTINKDGPSKEAE